MFISPAQLRECTLRNPPSSRVNVLRRAGRFLEGDCRELGLERCAYENSTTRYLQLMIPLSSRRDKADIVGSSLATGCQTHRLDLIQHRWTIGRPYLQNEGTDCRDLGLEWFVWKCSTARYFQVSTRLGSRGDMAVLSSATE